MITASKGSLNHHISDSESSQISSSIPNLGNKRSIEYFLSSLPDKSFLCLMPVNPQYAYVSWFIDNNTLNKLKEQIQSLYQSCKLSLLVYDITGIEFNGHNALSQHEFSLDSVYGSQFFPVDQSECTLIAEIGIKENKTFYPGIRSKKMYFQGPRDFSSGLYISNGFNRFHSTTQLYDISTEINYLKIPENSPSQIEYSVAIFLNDNKYLSEPQPPSKLHSILSQFVQPDFKTHFFSNVNSDCNLNQNSLSVDQIYELSMQSLNNFYEIHSQTPFHCIQSHNWYSAPAAMAAASSTYLPLITVFDSLEIERIYSSRSVSDSQLIESWERKSILQADTVIVSKESTAKLIVSYYGIDATKVKVIDNNNFNQKQLQFTNSILSSILSNNNQVLLFAGEISRYTGADLIIEALPNVRSEFPFVKVVFAGDGESRLHCEQLAKQLNVVNACHFFSNLCSRDLDLLFKSVKALLLPYRNKFDCNLIKKAIDSNLVVLTTHLASVNQLVHGVNGLLVYDNPGSVCWGIKEILSKACCSPEFNEIEQNKNMASCYSSIWISLISAEREGKETTNVAIPFQTSFYSI